MKSVERGKKVERDVQMSGETRLNRLDKIGRDSARGSILLLIGRMSSNIIMAITSIFVARLLGPEKYGLYAIILIVPNFLNILSDLGISSALLRYSAQLNSQGKGDKAAKLIRIGLLFKTGISVSFTLVLFIFSEQIATIILNRPSIGIYLRFTSIYLIGLSIHNTISRTFIGLDEPGKSSIFDNLRASIKALTTILLIIMGFGVVGAVLGTGLGVAIAALSGIVALFMISLPKISENTVYHENIGYSDGLKTLVIYGAPLYLSSVIHGLANEIRQIWLAIYALNTDIGNYKTATNFVTLINVIALPIGSNLFSAFSKLDSKTDKEALKRMFQYATKYISLIIIPVAVALAVLSSDIISLLYGDQYNLASYYLKLRMIPYLASGLGLLIIDRVFNSQGDTGTTFQMSMINSFLSIIVSIVLIPQYHVTGLIISVIVANIVSTLFALYKINNMYGIKLEMSTSIRIIITTLSSAILVQSFLNFTHLNSPIHNLAIGGIIYVVSFLIFAPIFQTIEIEDINNLERLLGDLPLVHPIIKIFFGIEKKLIYIIKSRKINS